MVLGRLAMAMGVGSDSGKEHLAARYVIVKKIK